MAQPKIYNRNTKTQWKIIIIIKKVEMCVEFNLEDIILAMN